MKLAIAVLAAGSSQRFGSRDKLTADFRGTMLGLHVTHTLADFSCPRAFVIASQVDHPCAPGWRESGFAVHANARAGEGMGTSVALAASLALQAQADALLICLADMPLVPRDHFAALLGGADALASSATRVSTDGKSRQPPALFGAGHFPALEALGGDRGARALLQQGTAIPCPAEWLADIDDPQTLALLNSR
ncbi:nucleotidyltransferase family protein [Parerythrobacter jejuensis]|uniref:NTP transferase domain-containing protein n=1 Tax=Parerythrobacter jejuensis TaxID=795812 RepID=A0A845ATS7_9SPHN|nr:NTP transferase domain-containing protein [Parerythrobacter jejuensis]MXP30248.1 NTP transferase domain-containing protein [Parerythrobacter jejuensis]MXP33008.1 NTP transferase domain-containing protein [Parerythrobacter jejuensis]